MVRAKTWLTEFLVGASESLAVIVIFEVPAATGVPLITPVVALSVSPDGNVLLFERA